MNTTRRTFLFYWGWGCTIHLLLVLIFAAELARQLEAAGSSVYLLLTPQFERVSMFLSCLVLPLRWITPVSIDEAGDWTNFLLLLANSAFCGLIAALLIYFLASRFPGLKKEY